MLDRTLTHISNYLENKNDEARNNLHSNFVTLRESQTNIILVAHLFAFAGTLV